MEYDQHKELLERIQGIQAIEIDRYKQSYYMTLFFNGLLAVGCAILAAYIVFHKHDTVPVQPAAISTEEYEATVQEQRRLQSELATAQKKVADLKAKSAHLAAQVKTQTVVLAQREQQLKDLQVSVPTQPIILEAIRKEVSTDKGFRQAVDRAFGNGMGARIKVVNE